MIQWPALPYEVVGKLAVGGIVAISLVAMLILAVVIFIFIWVWAMDSLTNLMWRGHDLDGEEAPPEWRCEVSYYAQALRTFDISKANQYREKAEKRMNQPTDADQTND